MMCLVLAFAGTPAAPSPSAAPGLRRTDPSAAPQVAPSLAAGVLLRATREAEGAIQKAAEAAAKIALRRRDPEYAEAWQEEAGDGIEATATLAIATARGRLARGKNLGQVRDLEEAFRLATEARKDLEALAGRLDQLRARQAVRDILIRGKLRKAQEKVAAEKAATDKPAAEKVPADKLAAEQESADKLARQRETDHKKAERREEATSGLEQVATTESRKPGPPSELRAAARALFRADYQEVVQSLAGATFSERRATVTAALLLAAARYYLYLEGGEKDLRLRQQAGANARTCRRMAPGLSPDPKLFSPRFVQFFRSALLVEAHPR